MIMERAEDNIPSYTTGENEDGSASQTPSNEISYEEIATKLLNDNLLLTALELYAELVEAGKDLPKLRTYFSNPGNFEHQASAKPEVLSTTIPRSLSQATLDSLDLTRYSEDGERGVDERVAVLEFELRKAKETISALRANLTVATESDTPSSEGATREPVKPHEKRALNFLVNEYLLLQGYKLTSITFADENENQDFETWDDVGLNIPKPAELQHLYRDYMKKSGQTEFLKKDNGCQTDLSDDVSALQEEVSVLQSKIIELEREKSEMQEQLWSYERIQNDAVLSEEACNAGSTNTENEDGWTAVTMGRDEDQVSADIDWASVGLSTPDQLKGSASGSGTSVSDPRSRDDVDSDWTVPASAPASALTTPTAEKPISAAQLLSPTDASERYKLAFTRPVSAQFQRELAALCLAVDLAMSVGNEDGDVVRILGHSLPRIIPNVILNKREEVIPLLVAAISSNCDQKQRDLLLNHLFNLKKRPDEEERRQILAGLRSVAASMTSAQVENEILPQCWEQLSHRHVERRLLVAEACSVLAPYMTPAIRNSLVLSMLQQLLAEDREESVRVAAVRCSALIASLSPDSDKYSQCEDIVLLCLGDLSTEVVNTTLKTLLLVVAQWALTTQRLQSCFVPRLVSVLNAHLSKAQGDRECGRCSQSAIAVVRAITTVLPHIVISVTSSETVVSHVKSDLPLPHPRGGFAELCKGLANPLVFYEAAHGQLMAAFDDLLIEESPMWTELAWIPEKMIPDLVEALCYVKPSDEEVLNAFVSLFRFLCSGIGHVFTIQQIKPTLLQTVQKVEKDLVEQVKPPALSVITVYLAGVLALAQTEKELEEFRSAFGSFLLALPMCRTSATTGLDCLKAVVVSICGLQRDPLTNAVLTVLWEGLTSPKAPVRCATSSLFMAVLGSVPDSIVLSRITPAIVTLASDPDISVRTSAIPAIGKLVTTTNTKEVQEKVRLQLQSILSDSSTRESSQLMLQLVTTLGQIISSCNATFRDEVVLPQLAALASYASQLQNVSGRNSLATALTIAFASADYCSLPKTVLSGSILPGLRQLEHLTPHLQPEHRETLYALIKEVETQLNITFVQKEERPASRTTGPSAGVEEMRQRMSKIFQPNRGSSSPSLQGLFRKK